MQRWTIVYDAGDGPISKDVDGKLSLDPMWCMVIDTSRQPSAVVLAIPTQRVHEVLERT